MLQNYSFQENHVKYEVLGGMNNLFDKLYNILIEYPIPSVIREEVSALLMVFLALLKPDPIGLRLDIYRHSIHSMSFRQWPGFPILSALNLSSMGITTPESTADVEKMQTINQKIARYQVLLHNSRQFIESILKEYYEKSLKELEGREVLSFRPDYEVIYSSSQPLSYGKVS